MQCACVKPSAVACPILQYPCYLINDTTFGGGGDYWTWMCFDFLYKFCLKHFSFYEELSKIRSQMHTGWSSCTGSVILVRFKKNEISWQISEKYSNIKFHENPPSGSRVVPCGRTDRQTDMTKLIVTFRNYTNAPKKEMVCVSYINMKERKDPASIKAKNNNFQTPCLQAGERKNLLIHKY